MQNLARLVASLLFLFIVAGNSLAGSAAMNEKTLNKMVKYHNENSKHPISCTLIAADTHSDDETISSEVVCQRDSDQKILSEKEFNKIQLAYEKRGKKLICKREKKTGTRLSTKVCRTVAQIEEEQERSKETLQNIQTRSKQFNPSGN